MIDDAVADFDNCKRRSGSFSDDTADKIYTDYSDKLKDAMHKQVDKEKGSEKADDDIVIKIDNTGLDFLYFL